MGKWEEINQLEVEDPEDMVEFSAEDLTWTEIWGDQVAIIPYCRLQDFIIGEQAREIAPTQFVVHTRRTRKVEEIKNIHFDTYFEYAMYCCAYGPESTRKIRVDRLTTTALATTKKKRSLRQSIKVGCQCHFIVRRLCLRPNDAVITYTTCRHIDKSGVVCHGRDAVGRPQTFNYAPHLTYNMRGRVKQMVEDGFNVTMIWDKLIYDVEHESGKLYTGIARDALVTRQDILNMYNDIKRQEYVKDQSDPTSVDCWYNQFSDKFFFYQKQDVVQNIPFIIGIQTSWMRSMMVEYSHNNVISMDSTFSTNKYGYQLYTLMVFDKHHNGVPIAWVISSRNTTEDIKKWLSALFNIGMKERPDWHVRAFMTDDAAAEIEALRCLTNSSILLCVWHVRRAWMKNVLSKVHGKENRISIFRALGEIMHSCMDDNSVQKAVTRIFDEFNDQKTFLEYFKATWLDNNKIYMWARAYRKFPHSNQDTNNAIESYHRYLKQSYLDEKNNACHRRIDWLIHVVLGKVEPYYIHIQRLKDAGIIQPRKCNEQLARCQSKAKEIPDEECVCDEKNNNEYFVRSQNKNTRGTWYKVIYRGIDFFFCSCDWALNGNVCKHVIKVETVVGKSVFGEHVSPIVSSDIIERPRFLVDLNEPVLLSPEIQAELHPRIESPNGNFSNPVDFTTTRLDNSMSEAEEMKFLMSSTHQTLRGLLNITPASVDQARTLNKLVSSVGEECNKMFNCTITPSKISKQRHHSFLSPLNKKRQNGQALHPKKDAIEFQRVGRIRAKKKSLDEQMEISSRKQRNVEHRSNIVQRSAPYNRVEGSTSQPIQSCRLRLFHDSAVEASPLLVDNSTTELVVNDTFNLLPQSNETYIAKESIFQEISQHRGQSNYHETHFEGARPIHTKRKTINEQMEISSRKQRNLEHRSDIVQLCTPHNRVEGSKSQSTQSGRLQLFHDNIVSGSSTLVDKEIVNVEVNETFNLWQHRPSSNIAIADSFLVPNVSKTGPTSPLIPDLNI